MAFQTIQDVENATAAEIKAGRAEAIEAAKGAADVAERFVSARLDAKTRDEKMAEQGETIKSLQTALDDSRARYLELDTRSAMRERAIEEETARANAMVGDLTAERTRASRLKKAAVLYTGAVVQAANVLNQAIAAAQIEEADTGTPE